MTDDDGSGASAIDSASPPSSPTFDDDLSANQAVENRLMWKELVALGAVAILVVVRQLWMM